MVVVSLVAACKRRAPEITAPTVDEAARRLQLGEPIVCLHRRVWSPEYKATLGD